MENDTIYSSKTDNFDQIERWSSTQVYLSKGFMYPFLHSITAGAVKPPAGYSQSETLALLDAYTPEDIPEERKVDLIVLQLEAFADFSALRAWRAWTSTGPMPPTISWNRRASPGTW